MSTVFLPVSQLHQEAVESDTPMSVPLPQLRAAERARRIARFWFTVFVILCVVAVTMGFGGLPV